MYDNQLKVITFFKKARLNNRLSHAYLLEGMESSDIKDLAIEIARLINCSEDSPCGSCPSCLKINKQIHPDVTLIEPSGPLRLIKIDQIRDIQKTVYLKPFEAKKKICIIVDADTMNVESANALLKVLEEPPAHNMLLLTTSRREKLLPTIISRCQAIHIPSLSLKEVETILMEEYAFTEQEAKLLSVISGREIKQAIQMKEEGFIPKRDYIIEILGKKDENDLYDVFDHAAKLIDDLEECKDRKKEELDRKFKEYVKEYKDELNAKQKKLIEENNKAIVQAKHRKDVEDVLNIILCWFRDLIVCKENPDGENAFLNLDREEEIKRFAKNFKYEVLLQSIENLNKLKKAFDTNANLKLCFEVLFLKLGVLA